MEASGRDRNIYMGELRRSSNGRPRRAEIGVLGNVSFTPVEWPCQLGSASS